MFKLTVYRNCIVIAQSSLKQSIRRPPRWGFPRSTLNFTNTREATRERCNRISQTRGTIKRRFPRASVKVSFIWWPDCPQYAVLNEQHSPAGREQRDIQKEKKKKEVLQVGIWMRKRKFVCARMVWLIGTIGVPGSVRVCAVEHLPKIKLPLIKIKVVDFSPQPI